MRVLHVIDSSGIGGAQSLLLGFVGHASTDTEHSVFVLRRRHEELLHPSEQITIFDSYSKVSNAAFSKLRSMVAATPVDVIHCHLPRSLVYGAALRKLMRGKVVLVAHEHGQILGSNDRTFLSDFSYCTMRRGTRRSFAHHVSVSNATRDGLVERIGVSPDAITVIPSFVDTDLYCERERAARRSDLRNALQVTDEDFVVGIAGRITAKKGWRVFMESFASLSKMSRPPVAVVTGNGPERADFEKAVAELPQNLKLHDLKWVDDIRNFYSSLDCFVAPSYAEGSPVAAREAMALGLPIIASDAEGFTDLIRDESDGLIFERGDAGQLAAVIERLSQDRQMADALGRNGAARAKEFSVGNYLKALDNVYNDCIRDPGE